MAKKKLNNQERHDQRIRKARQWLQHIQVPQKDDEALSILIEIGLFDIEHYIYAADVENVASQKLAVKLGGVKKETKETLSKEAMDTIVESICNENIGLFRHYEYWI